MIPPVNRDPDRSDAGLGLPLPSFVRDRCPTGPAITVLPSEIVTTLAEAVAGSALGALVAFAAATAMTFSRSLDGASSGSRSREADLEGSRASSHGDFDPPGDLGPSRCAPPRDLLHRGALATARRLAREGGLFCGPSSRAAVAVLPDDGERYVSPALFGVKTCQ